jgi:hypothetical protein
MTRRRLGAMFFTAIAGSTLATSAARADLDADGKGLFARARELRAHSDCASAVPLFRKAYESYPAGLGSLRNLAECSETLGQFASARRAWLDLQRALSTRIDPKYEGWAQDASVAAERLASKVVTLTIDVIATTPTGGTADRKSLDVTLNGEPVPESLIATPLVRDPGHYIVRVDGRGVRTPQEAALDLQGAVSKRIVLSVVVDPEEASSPAEPAMGRVTRPEAGPHFSADMGRRTGAWVAFSLGGASLLGTGVSFIVRQTALGDLQTQCPQYANAPCPAAAQSSVDRGRTASLLVDVFGAMAAVGLATGIVLLATGPKRTAAMAIALSPSGVLAHGSF